MREASADREKALSPAARVSLSTTLSTSLFFVEKSDFWDFQKVFFL